jgi:endogenous inhibitor of DNA gyrase (YacG/DUF329 family)
MKSEEVKCTICKKAMDRPKSRPYSHKKCREAQDE